MLYPVIILIICWNFLGQMSQICSKMVIFLFSVYFGGHFCYHSNGKSQIDTRLVHLRYYSSELIEKIGEKNTFIF